MEIKELRSVLYEKKNILWGAGENGKKVLLDLAALEIYVDLFCDSDKKKQGKKICNKKVVSPEHILRNHTEYHIIITVENKKYLQEIAEMMREYGVEQYTNWYDIPGIDVVRTSGLMRGLNLLYLYGVIRDSYKKRMIMYGGREYKKLKQLFSMLDVRIEYRVDDVSDEYEEYGGIVKPVCDLLDEEEGKFKVVVTPDKECHSHILDRLGLVRGMDYDFVSRYAYENGKQYILDPCVGYNFTCRTDDHIPGFVELGSADATSTIVLLGGSTTDETNYPFRSWGCCLADKFVQNGYKVKVFNGGCGGYRSSQELVKLIRDVIPLRPNVVISYTGYNDAYPIRVGNKGRQYPFIHIFQEDVFRQISEHYEYRNSDNVTSENYTLGLPDERSPEERFADNIRMMDSICTEFGIQFKAFLQPCFITKENSAQEKEMSMHFEFFHDGFEEGLRHFYQNAEQIELECMEDITWLFDHEDDVYLDVCHVNEHGNEVVAQFIYDYLVGKGMISK